MEKLVIPKGFKQTEVGVIPEDWKVISINDAITSRILVEQMDGNHGELYPKSHEFREYGVPYVGATDFYTGEINYKTCKRLSLARAAKFKKGIAKDGDVLFAHNATVGPATLVKTCEHFIIVSTTATYYRCNSDEIKNTYLLNFFRSELFKKQYSSVMSQSTRNQVPILAQRKFYIVLPNIKEQTAIANALSDVDALIAGLEKLIAKKQAIKTATMQQLLTGRTRLPEFANHPDGTQKGYKQTELGEIPEDWFVSKLRDLTTYINDGTHHTPTYVTQGVPFYSVENVSADDFQNVKYISEEEHNRLIKRCRPEKGDILMTRIGTLGKTKLIDWEVSASIYVSLALIKLNDFVSPNYVYEYSKSGFFKIEIEKRALVNATPQKINMAEIGDTPIVYPEKESEQTAIANILSDIDEEIQSLQQRLDKTRHIKQGMMQELLIGKTRLV